MARKFDKIPIKNKVGFYFKQLNLDSIVCLNEWNNSEIKYQFSYSFTNYILRMCQMDYSLCSIDFLKLLNGDKDFLRKI